MGCKRQYGIFVGYLDNIDGFLVGLKSKNEVIRSRDVMFEPETENKLLVLFPAETRNGLKPSNPKTRAEDVIDLKNSSENLSYSSENLKLNSELDLNQETSKQELRYKLNLSKRLIEIMLAEVDEPQNYTEAIQSENWRH